MDENSTDSQMNNSSSSTTGNHNKDVLAPVEGPREHLINTALKFLQNPKVISSPLYQKKAFLANKGLTQEEINIAVERSGVKETTESTGQITSQANSPPVHQYGPVTPVYPPIPPQSTWARLRDLTMTSVIIMGVSYAVYRLFEKYIRPLWLGKTEQEKRMERLETQISEIQKSVSDSLQELNKTLVSIQLSLQNQGPKYPVAANNEKGISDLKSDIASLKGLLLSKNQFPPAPTISPVLPAWQRATPSSSASETLANLPTKAELNTSSPPPSNPQSGALTSKSEQSNGEVTSETNGMFETYSDGDDSALTKDISDAPIETAPVIQTDISSPLPSIAKGLTHNPVLVSGQASNVSFVAEADQNDSDAEEVD